MKPKHEIDANAPAGPGQEAVVTFGYFAPAAGLGGAGSFRARVTGDRIAFRGIGTSDAEALLRVSGLTAVMQRSE